MSPNRKQDLAILLAALGLAYAATAARQARRQRDQLRAELRRDIADPGPWEDTVMDDILRDVPGGKTIRRTLDELRDAL